MLINFITEYASGDYRYLALETGGPLRTERKSRSLVAPNCSDPDCTTIPTCTLYDVEGDPIPYCRSHIEKLHETEEGWTRNDWNNVMKQGEVVAEWIRLNPYLFIES
jgi:hypothetical protein